MMSQEQGEKSKQDDVRRIYMVWSAERAETETSSGRRRRVGVTMPVDLSRLSPTARRMAEAVLSTEWADDLSRLPVYSVISQADIQRHQNPAWADPAHEADIRAGYGDAWCDGPQVAEWRWDGLRPGESPEAYLERHADLLARNGWTLDRWTPGDAPMGADEYYGQQDAEVSGTPEEQPLRQGPYVDPTTGTTCTCEHVYVPGGGGSPHAPDCPIRIERRARRDAEIRDRQAREARDQEARRAAEEARIAACPGHTWEWLSHEEVQCTRCGQIEFRADE